MLKAKVNRRISDTYREALSEAAKVKLHRMNIDLPVETFKQLKAKVALDHRYRSMTDAMKAMVETYLAEGER